ncbi:hypothetical protein [Nocardia sp. X0981]
MTASGIADRRNDSATSFSTAEIKARIEEMFAARTPTDRYDSRDRDEKEP